MDLAKYDVAIDRDLVYSSRAKQQIWTPARSPTGATFPYGLGWFVFDRFVRGARIRCVEVSTCALLHSRT